MQVLVESLNPLGNCSGKMKVFIASKCLISLFSRCFLMGEKKKEIFLFLP